MEKWNLQLKGKLQMMRLIKADFKKIFYIPSYRYLLIATFILSLLFSTFFLLTIGITEGLKLSSLSSVQVIDVSSLGIDVTAISMIIFSALFISKEVSDGTVHTNLAITPNRLKFFIMKLVFLTILSFLITAVVILGILTVDWIIMSINQMGSLELINEQTLLKAVGSFLMVSIYTLLSAIGAFFLQSMAGGIGFSLGLMFLPGLVRMLPESIGEVLLVLFPETAINQFMDITIQSRNLLLATALLFLWILLTSTLSYRRFKSIDY